MAKTFTLSVILLTTLFLSCKKKDIENEKTYYRAIKGKDTALFSIRTYKDRFYGEFEMIYGNRGKDSGAVRGQIIGDTLKGEYKYLSFGGGKSISPIILLKNGNKLQLGKGLKATYMGIPFYVKDVPINYNTGFIFEEIQKPIKKQ